MILCARCGKIPSAMDGREFWLKLDELVETCRLVIDRPQGSRHPHHRFVYPLNYGYLEGTRSGDGDGIDIWVGSLPVKSVTAIICTVDTQQKDAEIKLLLGCTSKETQVALATHNFGDQAGILVKRSDG